MTLAVSLLVPAQHQLNGYLTVQLDFISKDIAEVKKALQDFQATLKAGNEDAVYFNRKDIDFSDDCTRCSVAIDVLQHLTVKEVDTLLGIKIDNILLEDNTVFDDIKQKHHPIATLARISREIAADAKKPLTVGIEMNKTSVRPTAKL